ncbi:MAG TPA: 30S ribosomal protein S6--L-glutamate ligase [Saprospiraceae bacterium]|nr:30S ribosomal protein S6--L-glutamate ligase [Saprospiraceae bacterium]
MKIVILSRGPQLYSTQSLLRAGMRRGHQVRIIDHVNCHFTIQKGRMSIFHDGFLVDTPDAIIPRIGSSVTAKGAAVIAQFEAMNMITTVRSMALLQARDKLRCLQKLASCGIDVPKTAYLHNNEHLPAVINQLGGLPVVIKLLESTHGVGVILAETLKTAESTIEVFQKLRERVLLQEFIEESNGADIRVLVVAGKVVAAMKRQAQAGEFRSNLHRGASAEAVRITQQEKNLVIRATKIMGLDIAGVDLLRSERGPLVMEINASPGLEGIETITKVDVAGQVIRYLESRYRLKKEYANQ